MAPRTIIHIVLDDASEHAFGHPDTLTPNLDAIRDEAMLLQEATASVAICAPSRASFLSGQHPTAHKVFQNLTGWPSRLEWTEMITSRFAESGYTTGVFGKVFHPNAEGNAILEAEVDNYARFRATAISIADTVTNDSLKIGVLDDEASHPEWQAVAAFEEMLDDHDGSDLFVQFGVYAPHGHWVYPQKYFDLYPTNRIALDTSGDPDAIPAIAQEIISVARRFEDLTDAELRELVQAYYAGVSFADAIVGRVRDLLIENGLWDEAEVVIHSDHGYHLGDSEILVGKFTPYRQATKSPIIWKGPGIEAGSTYTYPVSLLDIAPTLLSRADIEPDSMSLDGWDLSPALIDGEPRPDPVDCWTLSIISVYHREANGTLYQLIWYPDETVPRIYDLENDRDLENDLWPIPIGQELADWVTNRYRIIREPDSTLTGSDGDDVFIPLPGVENIEGLGGDDITFLYGDQVLDIAVVDSFGSGDQIFVVGDASGDLSLQPGIEAIRYSQFAQSIQPITTINGNELDNDIRTPKGEVTVFGSDGDDRIEANTNRNSTFYGGAGKDFIDAGKLDSSDNTVFTGTGADTVIFAAGANSVHLQGSRNLLTVGPELTEIFMQPDRGNRIVFGHPEGSHRVRNFSVGDILQFDANVFRDITRNEIFDLCEQIGTRVRFDLPSGLRIDLLQTTAEVEVTLASIRIV